MQAILTIVDDAGVLLAEQHFDAMSPWVWRRTEPIRMPCLLDGRQTGVYELHGFAYQPTVRLTGKIGGF